MNDAGKMRKVILIGSPGGGKNFFSRKLSELTGLPLYHMDNLYWRKDKTHITRDELTERLGKITAEEEWIIDGNYGGTLEMRIKVCDTVFFFDIPTEECLRGVYERAGTMHDDLPWFEDKLDDQFIGFVKNFCETSRPKIMALLDSYPGENLITFRSREDVNIWLKNA